MFAVRYLLSQDGAYYNGIYPEADPFAINENAPGGAENASQDAAGGADAAGGTDAANPVYVYENPYFLPVGFMVDDNILNWNLGQTNPFRCQEDFYKLSTGLTRQLFHKLEPWADRLENITITSGGGSDGVYRYKPVDAARSMKAVYKVRAEADGPVYLYAKGAKIENVKVTNHTFLALSGAGYGVIGAQARSGDWKDAPAAGKLPPAFTDHNIRYPYIIDAQYTRAGDDIEIELIFDNQDADSFTLYAYYFDEFVFNSVWQRLSQQALLVTGYTDTGLDGVIEVIEPGLMYTSIPYSDGWRATVDGLPACIETIGDGALLAVRLAPGIHSVSFRYMTPGLIPGALITLCAALLLTVISIYKKIRRTNPRQPS